MVGETGMIDFLIWVAVALLVGGAIVAIIQLLGPNAQAPPRRIAASTRVIGIVVFVLIIIAAINMLRLGPIGHWRDLGAIWGGAMDLPA